MPYRNRAKASLCEFRYRHTPKGRFRDYKCGAKTRGIAFKLSFREFCKFWKKPCWYCGYAIFEIGLDRIDNAKGYIRGNILPCCERCNRAKDVDSRWEYVKLCNEVSKRHKIRQNRRI